jgi:hypothetical protein
MVLLVLVASFERNRSTCSQGAAGRPPGDRAGISGVVLAPVARAVVTEL